MKLKNKVCLIVGASSGMGRVTAIEAGRQGATVLVAARRKENCDAVVSQIADAGGEAESYRLDATDETSIDAALTIIEEKYGRLDCAFNNLGAMGGNSLIHETPSERWHDAIATNLTSVFLLMKREVPLLIKAGGGAIVNNSSMAGLHGVKSLSHYCAAKWGLIGLTKTAAIEYGEHNIRVNVIAPGIIETEKMKQMQASAQEIFDDLLTHIPSRRFGEMNDIAQLTTWLMSHDARYVNGAMIPIDGGRSAG